MALQTRKTYPVVPGLEVWDNGGETCDRYTVLIGSDIYHMSDNATSPNGVNCYGGHLSHIPHPEKWGFVGNRVESLASLPDAVQRAITQRMNA